MINADVAVPKILTHILDNLPTPFFIRDKESTEFIYANVPLAHLVGLSHPDKIIGKIDNEIPCRLFEDENSAKLWQNQVRHISSTHNEISLLEVHPDAIDHPYITKKFPFFNEEGECIGMAGFAKYLEVYSPNDFVKGKLPGSLLLNKPDDFFTEKECEVIFFRLQGMNCKEISKILCLSPRTIENRLAFMYTRAGVNHMDDFQEFCEKRDLHRYLPKRLLLNKKIGFEGDFFDDTDNFQYQ